MTQGNAAEIRLQCSTQGLNSCFPTKWQNLLGALTELTGSDIAEHDRLRIVDALEIDERNRPKIVERLAELLVLQHGMCDLNGSTFVAGVGSARGRPSGKHLLGYRKC